MRRENCLLGNTTTRVVVKKPAKLRQARSGAKTMQSAQSAGTPALPVRSVDALRPAPARRTSIGGPRPPTVDERSGLAETVGNTI